MTTLRHLSSAAKEQVIQRLKVLLAQRSEVLFACALGSFPEPERGFHDIDIAAWVDTAEVPAEAALEYQWELSSWLERHIPHPMDIRVLNYASLGFRHAASGGLLLIAKDEVLWYDFREETWQKYLDFAPLARGMLFDLLDEAT